jgi:hypothetical protein
LTQKTVWANLFGPIFLGQYFWTKSFWRNVFGPIFGRFLTNSSGHPEDSKHLAPFLNILKESEPTEKRENEIN